MTEREKSTSGIADFAVNLGADKRWKVTYSPYICDVNVVGVLFNRHDVIMSGFHLRHTLLVGRTPHEILVSELSRLGRNFHIN
jgi:hypothetical protein